ncbi:hypothetical protein JYU34_022722, partial [Plutella xylostella]
MVLERDRLFNIWFQDKTNMLKRLQYTKYRNKCTKHFSRIRNEYDKQKILECNGDVKKIWDNINRILGNKKRSTDDVILKYMSGNSKQDICNNFATTFKNDIDSITHDCNDKLLNRADYSSETCVSMRWRPVSSKE